MNMKRKVAITGIGQSKHRGHRQDVNEPELVWEGVSDALADSRLDLKDVDCIIHGNMELFEGIHQPDMWHTLGDGARMKEGIRITTGGTTGGMIELVQQGGGAVVGIGFLIELGFLDGPSKLCGIPHQHILKL